MTNKTVTLPNRQQLPGMALLDSQGFVLTPGCVTDSTGKYAFDLASLARAYTYDGASNVATVTYGPDRNGRSVRVTKVWANGLLQTESAPVLFGTAAAGLALSGAAAAVVGTASGNITVSVTPAGSYFSPFTFTPSDSGAGGTFVPPSVELSFGSETATFKYTPVSEGVKHLTGTVDQGGLPAPAIFDLTASAQGKAAAPAQVVATASGTSVTLTWPLVPAANNGGTPVRNYLVKLSDGSAQLVPPNAVNWTFRDVKAGVAVTGIVAAVTDTGVGTAAKSTAVTPGDGPVGPIAPPRVPVSVRTRLNMTSGAHAVNLEHVCHRVRQKSNAVGTNVVAEFVNGYVVSTGASGLPDLERGVGNAVQYMWSFVTGFNGANALNLAALGGIVRRLKFLGMLNDPAFVAAGGAVSADGYTITVPDGFKYRNDPITDWNIVKGEVYYSLGDLYCAAGLRTPRNVTSHSVAVGDAFWNSATGIVSGRQLVASADWSGTTAASINPYGALAGPLSVWADGVPGTVVFGVAGDSIIAEVTGSAALALTPYDLGDDDGCQNFAKRALNALGLPFVCVAVSGSNVRDLRDFQPGALRGYYLQWCDVIITNALNNDRATGRAYNSASGLGTLYAFDNDWLRSKGKPGCKIIRVTSPPATFSTVVITSLTSVGTKATAISPTGTMTEGQIVTIAGAANLVGYNVVNAAVHIIDGNSFSFDIPDLGGVAATTTTALTWSDGWATLANQTFKNGDATWPSGGPSSLVGGQYELRDKIMRQGTYVNQPYGGPGECDAGYDYCSVIWDGAGRYKVNGTRYYLSDDGTHQKIVGELAAAVDFQQKLSAILEQWH
jgi:hypothetical protein